MIVNYVVDEGKEQQRRHVSFHLLCSRLSDRIIWQRDETE